MAYTIVKTNGTVLTTIPDGTINTTSTSLGLPGRNFAGYGQSLDTNFVHMMENFANVSPPPNPLQGQLWYNTSANLLCVCPADGTTDANSWLVLTTTATSGTTTFGDVDVKGNLQANNITAINSITGDVLTVRLATVNANATIGTANIAVADIGNTFTNFISSGSNITQGTLQGTWTVEGGYTGNSLVVTNGNIYTVGIKTDNYFYANGVPFNGGGSSYGDSNVFDYLTGANGVTQFVGNITPHKLTSNVITAGSNVALGNMYGSWTMTGNGTTTLTVGNGNIVTSGIKTDSYYFANGSPFAPYANSNVSAYLPTYQGQVGTGAAIFTGANLSTSGNITVYGILSDNYYYSNGTPINFTPPASYSNSNVAAFLPTFTGTVGAGTATFYGTTITTGSNATNGQLIGTWTLSSGSTLQATYADLAERFESDTTYEAGTVVEIGGEKEITAVKKELSEDVFGVISSKAAYVMNAMAGNDITHPAVAIGGRVPVKVVGKIRKGQRLVSAGKGLARGAKQGEATAFNIIGRSLQYKTTDEIGTIEAFVKIN
jgi:hypothetical protein